MELEQKKNEELARQKEELEEVFRKTVKRANKAVQDKDYEEAITAYKEALKIHPDDEWCLARLKIAEYQAQIKR